MRTSAVSEVVGTLILVGVVVLGIVLASLLLFSNPAASRVPVFNCIISNQSSTIYIYHKGGDSLSAGEYRILVDGVDRTSSFVSNGDEPWSVGETLSYTSPTMPGKVVILFTENNGGGATLIGQSDLRPVEDVPLHMQIFPSVAWSSSPVFGNITTQFQFTDGSSGDNVTSYYWDFGDANTSATKSLSHAFPCNSGESCTFSINHAVTDSGNTSWAATSWLNRSAWVTVYRNLTPTVTFDQDRTHGPASCFTVQFNATRYGAIRVDSWLWNFGGSEGTSNSEDPSHTYTTQGVYTVTLTATNNTLGQTVVTKSNLITVTEPWFDCSWLYRKKITIDGSKVPGALSDFPVLISFTHADLSTARNDGYDILFTNESGTTQRKHVIESFRRDTGSLDAWVKVPSLPSGSNTILFIYYGNSGSPNQQDEANVWDANYVAVWHLNEAGSAALGEYKDSKNSNHGQGGGGAANAVPSQTTGQVNRSQLFDASNDWIDAKSAASVDDIFGAGGTFSAWIRPTGVGENSEGRIGDKSTSTSAATGWAFSTYTGPELRFRKSFGTTSGIWSTAAGTISTAGVWQHVVVTYNQGSTSNDPFIYINGVKNASPLTETAPVGAVQSDATPNLVLGNYAGAQSRTFDGKIDEVRASKTIRTGNWILTEYNNQGSPSTFFSLGTQETSTGY